MRDNTFLFIGMALLFPAGIAFLLALILTNTPNSVSGIGRFFNPRSKKGKAFVISILALFIAGFAMIILHSFVN